MGKKCCGPCGNCRHCLLGECCCCISLEKGAKIVGIYYIVRDLLLMAFLLWILCDYKKFLDLVIKKQENSTSNLLSLIVMRQIYPKTARSNQMFVFKVRFEVLYSIILIAVLAELICSILLVVRKTRFNPKCVSIWLLVNVITMVLLVFGLHYIDVLFLLIWICPHIYWWYCVYCWLQKLKESLLPK